MTNLIASAEAVWTLSLLKPIPMLAVFAAYAWFVSSRIDKWLEYYYLPRQTWNITLIGTAVLALLLWLLIPIYIVGMLAAIVLLGGALGGYVFYHNSKVNPSQRIHLSLDVFRQKMQAAADEKAQRDATVRMLKADGSPIHVPTPGTPQFEAHGKFEDLLEFALPRKAERFDLAVSSERAVAMVYVDGVRYLLPSFEPRLGLALVDYFKATAGLDVDDRRRKQVGELHFTVDDGRHMIALTTSGSTREMTVTAIIDNVRALSRKISELGLLPVQIEAVNSIFKKNQGVVLVASPPMHGQTTTIYSLLQMHDPYQASILTLEDEIATEVEGVTHQELEPGEDAEAITRKVAGMIRQDPGVIMLSRLADAKQAQLIAKSADQMRFYVGIQGDDTYKTLKGWVKTVGDPKLAAQSLSAIICQRLVRELCTTCRVPYTPDGSMLQKLNLSADKVKQFYKHSGQVKDQRGRAITCTACAGMGYRGRVGVYEVMVLDDQARAMLAEGNFDQVRAHCRKQRMPLLQEAGIVKVAAGMTSISEITRALSKDADKPIKVQQEQ